jgi:two-component system, chemotaxis family, chemotaxis protein CheY
LKGSKHEYEHDAPILVVEDDPFILETVTDVLQFEGYRVETAMNGLEGLAVIERVRPSLVLLDMRMPIMNGWDFARALMERGIRLPILVMTAAQDANRWASEIGADGYIAKPFHLTDLLDAVEGLLKAEPGDGHLH